MTGTKSLIKTVNAVGPSRLFKGKSHTGLMIDKSSSDESS
jgi:hypothetical protein